MYIISEDEKKFYEILEILKNWTNRENWKSQIEPYIIKTDIELRISYITEDDWFAFLPEELDINYQWKFKVGDIVTDGDDIMVITHLPNIHPENKDYREELNQINGNTYWIIRLDKNGNDMDINDPTYYLHNYFNENQIWKVDEETEKKYKELMKGKKYYINF